MLKQLRLRLTSQKGSSAVLFTVTLTVMLTMAAIVVDLGGCYLETSNLQNAVDAAAMAAAAKLPIGTCDIDAANAVQDTADQYLIKNGVSTDGVQVNPINIVNGKYTGISVSASATVKTSFAKIIGVNSLTLTRSAAAVLAPIKQITGLVPLSIDKDYMNQAISSGNTQHLTLKFGATTGVQGSFGAVDLDGSKSGGANDYACNLLSGYSDIVTVGSVLPVEPGNMSGPTFDSFWSRYDSCTHFSGQGGCTVDHYKKNCPRVVMVPVVRYIDSKSVEVSGFAAFILEAGTGNGTQSTVTGSFVNFVTQGASYDKNGVGASDDFGVYTVHLIS